jgi:hypothetical protein
MMKRTLLALCAIAAMTTVSAGVASAQEYGNPGRPYQRPEAFTGSGRSDNCRIVISHRMGPNGSVTVRRRICY